MASTWYREILIDKMALEADISKADAKKALDALTNGVEEALRDGAKVTLTGFGTFEASDRKARTGRNPQTGQPMRIAAHRVATFRAGSRLKDALNEETESAFSAPSTPSWQSSRF